MEQDAKSNLSIKLVDGTFTANEAREIILALINKKISFHELKSFQSWEKNHQTDLSPFKARIAELEKERKLLKQFIEQNEENHTDFELKGELHISIEKNKK
ncbi:hypothetical protein ACFSQ0_05205 [Mesonia sediminis]|uniref:Uncharacterized protein n=1 Tax=Mesonia sediminis TaxID=1703946 RepID=A0ABW5SCD0_9FLAO